MNVLTVFSAMAPYIRGRSLRELFPAHFMQNLPFYRIQQGCCIFCIRPMTYEEMFPPDRLTPRAICPECWAALTDNISEVCWVCSEYLEGWKINRKLKLISGKSQKNEKNSRQGIRSLVSHAILL